MSILFLLIIASAVYVLFFHKFTLQDGSEVKGWLAKHKAEQGEGGAAATPQSAPKAKQSEGGAAAAPKRAPKAKQSEDISAADAAVPQGVPKGDYGVKLISCRDNKLEVVKAITENTTLPLQAAKEAADNAPILFIAGLGDSDAYRINAEISFAGGETEVVEGALQADKRMPWAEAKDWFAEEDNADEVAADAPAGINHVPQRPPKGNKGVRLISYGDNRLMVVKAIGDNTTLGLQYSVEAANNAPILFIAGIADDEAERIATAIRDAGGKATIEEAMKADERMPWAEAKEPVEDEGSADDVVAGEYEGGDDYIPSDAMGLDMDCTLDDFERVFDIAKNDLFGSGWDAMEACYGWMLLGAAREDDSEININTIWEHISNIYAESKEALRGYYREQIEQGEMPEESLHVMPEWFANIYLLNGFNPFIMHADKYFSDKRWNEINERVDRWGADLNEARNYVPEGREKQFYDEPNAADFLVRLHTILMGESDNKLEANKAMFKSKYSFDFELPKVMPK